MRLADRATTQAVRPTDRASEVEDMAVRSKLKRLAEGEKVTKYFCNLENRNFTNKYVYFWEKDNRDFSSDQHDMMR